MRVISGTAGGKKLKTLPGTSTRPTSDKVKGAIFNVLGAKVLKARVLDLFSGSGALGIEALSRGADFALLVDKSSPARNIIDENVLLTGFYERARVLNRDAKAVLRELEGEVFDLIFIDPPYRQGLALISLEILAGGNFLSPDGVIVVETSREEALPVEIGKLSMRKSGRYGDTVIHYYQLTETERREN